MTRRARRTHVPAFKAKVALAAIKGEETLGRGSPGAPLRRIALPPPHVAQELAYYLPIKMHHRRYAYELLARAADPGLARARVVMFNGNARACVETGLL